MAFGEIRSSITSSEDVPTTVHRIALPPDIVPGDYLVLFFAHGLFGNGNMGGVGGIRVPYIHEPNGFTQVTKIRNMSCWVRRVTGCEEASTIAMTEGYVSSVHSCVAIKAGVHDEVGAAQQLFFTRPSLTIQLVTQVPGRKYVVLGASWAWLSDPPGSATFSLPNVRSIVDTSSGSLGTHVSDVSTSKPPSTIDWGDDGSEANAIAISLYEDTSPVSRGWHGQIYDPNFKCSCCQQAEKCECRDGKGGPIVLRKDLQITIGGSMSPPVGSDSCVDTLPCPSVAGTYVLSCGDTLDVWAESTSCTTGPGEPLWPEGAQLRLVTRVTHSSGLVSSPSPTQYPGSQGGGVVVSSYFGYFDTEANVWRNIGPADTRSRGYVLHEPGGFTSDHPYDRCPQLTQGSTSSFYAGGWPYLSCNLGDITIDFELI